jgi:transcriptional regulator
MYDMPHFKAGDQEEVIAFIKDHPFATILAVSSEGKPVATQVPMFIDERDGSYILSGHFMRRSEHHLAFETNPHALVLFTGPHAYVSASWYTNPKMASTWNYMSVQASGTLRFLDEEGLLGILKRTTDHFEGRTDSPASLENMEANYIERMIKAIVAFEVKVDQLEHVFKLSQNRDDASKENVIRHLEKGDPSSQYIAKVMKAGKYIKGIHGGQP